MNDLFARVRPLVGEVLDSCCVAVVGTPTAGVLVEYLVACGVRHWLVMAGNGWMAALVAKLRDDYGKKIDITVSEIEAATEVSWADLALVVDDAEIASNLPLMLPRLAIFTPSYHQPSYMVTALPGEKFDLTGLSSAKFSTAWDWLTVAPLIALSARALLLRGTAYAMATWEDAWVRGQRVYVVGAKNDPTHAMWQTHLDVSAPARTMYHTSSRPQGTLLIVGLGSLGSVAAQQLAPRVERMVLVDPDCVEVANLVRQAFTYSQLGEAKAMALAQSLCAANPGLVCEPVVASLSDEAQGAALVDAYGVTAALVTTGTFADFAISRVLHGGAIPHVIGRCYARARFWEGIVVDGTGGSTYEQVRREVAAGPTPTPTPEEVATYGAVGELVGEPATAMETGWAAMWLARLTAQMMAPATLREGWLLARLAVRATCFIGGLEVVQRRESTAYGVAVPGEVHAWSTAEIGS